MVRIAGQPLPVSVVIPVYNRLDRLVAAVDSVRRQQCPPREVVVVDDGSTEGAAEEVLGRAGTPAPGTPRLRVVRQENGGPSRARNRGIALAEQPWIAFLDADDLWEPDKLALQWRAVQRHPAAVLVSTDWRRPGTPRPERPIPPARRQRRAARRVAWLNRFQTSTVLARRAVLVDAGLFAPEMDGLEDWDMWLRVVARGPWVHIPYPLVLYWDTPGGVSKDTRRAYRVGAERLTAYRERRADARVSGLVGDRLLLWHHLRFALAFWRLGDREMGRRALATAWRPGTRLATLGVALSAMGPYLWGRVRARLRGAAAGRPDGR